MSDSAVVKNHGAFIWSVADLLRGDYKPHEYGRVILPFTVLRRLDCVLEATKAGVLAQHEALTKRGIQNIAPVLEGVAGQQFFNTSPLTLSRVLDDPNNVAANLQAYIAGFSTGARDVLEKFDFDTHIARMDKAKLLYLVTSKFAEIDLHPEAVSNLEMGYLYEELIRKFSELSNETAGEHFTPREVIRLMVNLLFIEDDDLLRKPGVVKTLFDPACGTGGMLSVAEDHLRTLNPNARLEVFGQELNPESYAICRSDMMLKGQDASHITQGNSFSEDGHEGQTFDYLLANPPFGVEWKKVEDFVKGEAATKGFAGRFGAGLPRINDGSFLFLQHMISKMRPVEKGGSRLAIVFNGSPLFTGAAGSGESEIRRWIIENDWLEAVVALPDQLFYNTGISTYFWVVTNRKAPERRGKVQLLDARGFFVKMRKSLGEKRKEISADQIDEITRLYGDFTEGDRVKIFPNTAFGFQRITVERPLRLRWEITPETIGSVKASKTYAKLDEEKQRLLDYALDLPQKDELGQNLVPQPEQTFRTLAEVDEDMGWRAIFAHRDIGGMIIDPVMPPWKPGAFAGFLGVTKAQGDAILQALAVRDPDAPIVTDRKGNPQPDPDLRDAENVPLPEVPVAYEADLTGRLATVEYRTAIAEYVEAEVKPWVPDAWVDHTKTKLGYEIPLTRHFYKYLPPRPLAEIDAEIKALEAEIQALLAQVTE